MRALCAISAVVCILASGGCSEVKETSTQVTLRVQVDDSELLQDMTHLRVTVMREDEEKWVQTSRATLTTDQIRWPLDIPIVPSSPGSVAKRFEVIADALAGDDRLAQARAVSSYERDALRVLELWLYRCAGHDTGFVCASDNCHGTECETCSTSGNCQPVPWSDPEALPVFSATKTPVAKAPPERADRCGIDSRCSEHATCTDTPAGPLCSCKAGFEDRDGDGTVCVDKCTVAGCDPHATCTIMGGDAVCSCTPPYTGKGTSCTFDEACSQLECDSHATCVTSSSGGRECACAAGYTGLGTDCVNIDECTQTPSPCGPNSTCVDSDGSFSCSCATGYRDTGSGCELVDGNDCSPNRCMNGGSCRDLVNGFSCKCPAGFDGERCERNLNDCTSSSCSNGTCIDGVNTYTCSCDSGFTTSVDQKSCVQIDDCAGTPCGEGGVCVDGTNTYSCTCSSGYSGTGTKSCTNIDDCAGSNTCSPEGRCIDGLNGYMCQCNGAVPLGVPANSCRFTFKGDGVYDSQTGLSWSTVVYEIYKSTDTPQAGCQRQGEGRRPPTFAELQTVIAFDYFNTEPGVNKCWATTTNDFCGPGATAAADTHGLRCVR